jgi:hypothetical protein
MMMMMMMMQREPGQADFVAVFGFGMVTKISELLLPMTRVLMLLPLPLYSGVQGDSS